MVTGSSSYFQAHKLEWHLKPNPSTRASTFYTVPIISFNSTKQPLYNVENPYYFDIEKETPTIEQQKSKINDYFKLSLFACLTCFWMVGGIICLIQSLRIKRLKKVCVEQALRKSNRLHTNLILTYVFGGITYLVLVMTVLISFFVGIKGYFAKSI
ncbi:unnamed protein product [Didymodactylos carnosus]|uniref:Uncharacterized protein n=1 Tax=Didymodactylos carnosus TaxID=1234261 RepID=A0A813SF48_9BILA|nr:unnamed protein product [Didymodactylos carnosus]CAF0794583.1 unnamed protein product [Didymodactylos carnosus]CAF3548729.1 unnamed protein product [Didymodactylos carnosus]CAF3578915.1 unnamed protein product [Didymodactylos carnosus]